MPATSVVVAVKGSPRNLSRILDALSLAQAHETELVFAIAGETPSLLARPPSGAKIVSLPEETLVPLLWRDGIRAASARRVALLTSECVPASDWLALVVETDVARWAGIGGTLVNDEASDARNWAVYLLRYLRFAPPSPRRVVDDIAADNAVYDRLAILDHPGLLDGGFWEPSFHARFLASGREMLFDPQLRVTHSGTNEALPFMRHRYAHGHQYGRARAEGVGTGKNIALLIASPFLPFLMLYRIFTRAAKSDLLASMAKSSLYLLLFVLAWAAGECSGYFAALVGCPKRKQSI